jgi:hypothetical protein
MFSETFHVSLSLLCRQIVVGNVLSMRPRLSRWIVGKKQQQHSFAAMMDFQNTHSKRKSRQND